MFPHPHCLFADLRKGVRVGFELRHPRRSREIVGVLSGGAAVFKLGAASSFGVLEEATTAGEKFADNSDQQLRTKVRREVVLWLQLDIFVDW